MTVPPVQAAVASIKSMTSALVDRVKLAARIGQTFDGKRDVGVALGYEAVLTPAHFRWLFTRGDIAARIVEAPVKATWRGGGELVEDEDPNVLTPFEAAFFSLADRLAVWPRFMQADTLAGLGNYAVILIGAAGTLREELPQMKRQEDVLYLKPYAQDNAKVNTYVEKSDDARYGQPLTYTLTRVTRAGVAAQPETVHWSRILPVAHGLLDDDIYGTPDLERVWNRFCDLIKVVGGGSEAFWQRVHQGMQLDMDKDVAAALAALPDGGAATVSELSDQIDEYQHNMRRVIRTSGIDLKMLGGDVSSFSSNAEMIVTLIAGATGIPKRILLGSEMGELASTQDASNWNERILDRRTQFAEPIVRMLVDRLVEHGALPEHEGYEVRWPQMENMDEAGKASLANTLAEANQAQVAAGGGIIATENEIRDRVFGWAPLDELDDAMQQDDLALAARAKKKLTAAAAAKKRRGLAISGAVRPRLSIVPQRNTSRGAGA